MFVHRLRRVDGAQVAFLRIAESQFNSTLKTRYSSLITQQERYYGGKRNQAEGRRVF
jgi:hypothetical protein